MSLDVVQEREQAHAYLDRLPAAQLSAVRTLLETMVEAVSPALANAPFDDEPFTEQDRQAVAEADQWLERNRPLPLETVLADFGLNLSDWEQMGKSPVGDADIERG